MLVRFEGTKVVLLICFCKLLCSIKYAITGSQSKPDRKCTGSGPEENILTAVLVCKGLLVLLIMSYFDEVTDKTLGKDVRVEVRSVLSVRSIRVAS